MATTRIFTSLLSGEPLLELPASASPEEARQHLARALRHFPRGTHLLEASTGHRIFGRAFPSSAGARCNVLLAQTFRVTCAGCGRGMVCSCGLAGSVARGCQCAPSALASDLDVCCYVCAAVYATDNESDDAP